MRFKNKMSFWKPYFYLYSVLLVVVPLLSIGKPSGIALIEIVTFLTYAFQCIGWLGLYGFVFGKRIFAKNFWGIFLAIELLFFAWSVFWPMLELLFESFSSNAFAMLIIWGLAAFVSFMNFALLFAHYNYFQGKWLSDVVA